MDAGAGFALKNMNNFGGSLVLGTPIAPMGTRAVIELVKEPVQHGGGFGLFAGCAAGAKCDGSRRRGSRLLLPR